MKQFSRIFAFELKYYFKNKIFVGITVFLAVAIAVTMFIPNISAMFKSSKKDTTENNIMLISNASFSSDITLKEFFSAAFSNYEVILSDDNIDKIKEQITSNEVECAFVIDSPTSFTYLVNNLSIYDANTTVATELLQKHYQFETMLNNGMSADSATDVMSIQINGTTESLGVNQANNYWYSYIMIYALYMVILLYGQMVATNVAAEKSSRAMEVLITSARPVSMMFGKVLASCMAGFVQMAVVFGSAILFYNINSSMWKNQIIKSIFDMPPHLFGFLLLFFVLGFLIYAFMFGAVGSTASKLEDVNTSVLPITLLFVAGFIVVMISLGSGNTNTLLMKICSFIPFTASMAMFTRISMSTVPWYEIAISVAILMASASVIGVISARIYRVGVLLYGNSPKLGSLIKNVLKNKRNEEF